MSTHNVRFAAKEIARFETHDKCSLCRTSTVDEFKLGKIYKYLNIVVHYFCLLFATELQQNGSDEQGILGFLISDIKKELQHKRLSICAYCRKPGAVSKCAGLGCKIKFHYPCGIENQSFHVFCGQFNSYCYDHRKVQIPCLPSSATISTICVICQSDIEPKPNSDNVWASCCKTSWFHRDCVQRLALSAGYFFKCPNCNNEDLFRNEMLMCGIYIPDQDAAWELESHSYRDLTERYNSCDANFCLCVNGRSFSRLRGNWKIILCHTCGSQGIHYICGKFLLNKRRQWTCSICSPVASMKSAPRKKHSLSTPLRQQRSQKRFTRSSLPNNVGVFHNRTQQQTYTLRERLKMKPSTPEMAKVGRNIYYRSMNNEWRKSKEKVEINETPKRKIRRVKYNVDGIEVRILSTYKRILKDFHIFLSKTPFSPRHCKRFSLV